MWLKAPDPTTTQSLSGPRPHLVSSEGPHPHTLAQCCSSCLPLTTPCSHILSPQLRNSASLPSPPQCSPGGPLMLSAPCLPICALPCPPWPGPSHCFWVPQGWQTPHHWGLALPCCVKGDPDAVEATGFGQPPLIILCLPWPASWLASWVIHGPVPMPGGSLCPHVNKTAGLRGEDTSRQITPISHPPQLIWKSAL